MVFLDIDGVLNHHGVYAQCAEHPEATKPEDWLDPACIARLNTICERTGAVIVISSSWREYLHGWEGVRDVLALRGLTAEVIDHTVMVTDRVRMGWYDGLRWDEIQLWLTEHPGVTHYVVLEDALIDGVPEDHLVQTTLREGLTPELAERAVALLEIK